MSRQPFNNVWSQDVDTENDLNSFKQPSVDRIDTGWEGGLDKDPPPAGEENWWHNRVDVALQNIERFGAMTWHAQAIYSANAPVRGSDGNFYESLAGSNIGNNPTSTTGFWRLLGASLFSPFEPGDLKTVAHNNVPSTGWLKCNGSVLTRTSYQRLFDTIGTTWNTGGESVTQFRLPDFRGEFLRGFDDGRGVDAGRAFASAQADAYRAHFHIQGSESLRNIYGGGDFIGARNYPNGTFNSYQQQYTSTEGGTETRPRNKAVNYWIKY